MFKKITQSVYMVGGEGLSDSNDCLVYLVDLGEIVLIDCGAGQNWMRIADNIVSAGYDPANIDTLILTHCHVDHIGAASQVAFESGCKVVCHDLDQRAIQTGDPALTAADWYGVTLPSVDVTSSIRGKRGSLQFSSGRLDLIHTPGHTPGSLVVLFDSSEGKILFGQDIHGPFSPQFNSDLKDYRRSMKALLQLEVDILCEGHFGIYRGQNKVREFIESHLSANS